MFFVYVKDFILVLLPFLLCQVVFQFFYQTSIYKVTLWWVNYHNEIDHQSVIFVGMLFVFLTIWATAGSVITKISYALSGEEYELVYVGNNMKHQALLYNANDLNAFPINDYNLPTAAFSFENIYRKVTYKREKGSHRLGLPKTSTGFPWSSVITSICFLIALTPVFLALTHSLAYVVSMKIEMVEFSPSFTWQEAWLKIFEPYGFSLKRMLLISGFFIIGPMVTFSFLPSSTTASQIYGERITPLPTIIRPNSELKALPIGSYKIITEGTGNATDSDTGRRVIIYKFDDVFLKPVYVSYMYDAKEQPNLEEIVGNNINNNIMMRVEILENLAIKPVLY